MNALHMATYRVVWDCGDYLDFASYSALERETAENAFDSLVQNPDVHNALFMSGYKTLRQFTRENTSANLRALIALFEAGV